MSFCSLESCNRNDQSANIFLLNKFSFNINSFVIQAPNRISLKSHGGLQTTDWFVARKLLWLIPLICTPRKDVNSHLVSLTIILPWNRSPWTSLSRSCIPASSIHHIWQIWQKHINFHSQRTKKKNIVPTDCPKTATLAGVSQNLSPSFAKEQINQISALKIYSTNRQWLITTHNVLVK